MSPVVRRRHLAVRIPRSWLRFFVSPERQNKKAPAEEPSFSSTRENKIWISSDAGADRVDGSLGPGHALSGYENEPQSASVAPTRK